MITETFDNQSPAKINLTRNENAPKVDAVILTFSNMIEQFVVEHYDCEKVGELWAEDHKGTQHDAGHFNIAITLAEYIAENC